jgi:VanZ family protein
LKFLKYWFPVLLYCCIIFCVSAIPNVQFPGSVPTSDKLLHMFEYAILGVLFARAVRVTSQTQWFLLIWANAVFFTAFYGITDEFHQSFTPGRASDLADLGADISGGSIGAALYLFWKEKSSGKKS